MWPASTCSWGQPGQKEGPKDAESLMDDFYEWHCPYEPALQVKGLGEKGWWEGLLSCTGSMQGKVSGKGQQQTPGRGPASLPPGRKTPGSSFKLPPGTNYCIHWLCHAALTMGHRDGPSCVSQKMPCVSSPAPSLALHGQTNTPG